MADGQRGPDENRETDRWIVPAGRDPDETAAAADPAGAGEPAGSFSPSGPYPSYAGMSETGGGHRLAEGFVGCGVVLLVLAVVGIIALANFHPLGEPLHAVALDSRFSTRDVVLSDAAPSASLRITFTYRGSTDHTSLSIATTTPREAGGTTPDPSAAYLWLTDPAVRVTLAPGWTTSATCFAACERELTIADCSTTCTETVDVHLELVDAAGRGPLTITVSAGGNASVGEHLPDGFDVRIDDVAGSAIPPRVVL